MKTIISFAYQFITNQPLNPPEFNWNTYTKRKIKPPTKHYLEERLERLKNLASKARSEHNRIKCIQAYYLIQITQQKVAEKSKLKLSYLN